MFRLISFWIAVLLCVAFAVRALLLRGSRPARIEGDTKVVEYDRPWRELPVLLILLIGLGLFGLQNQQAVPLRTWWIPYVLLAVLLGVLVVYSLEVFRSRLLVREDGLMRFSAWGAPRFIGWDEVSDARWIKSAQELELKASDGKVIRVSRLLSGLEALAAGAESHLAQKPSVLQTVQAFARR